MYKKKSNNLHSALASPVVIVANGEFPAHPVPLTALETAGTVVCCDGATEKLCRHAMTPDHIVGDLDSLPPALKRRFADRLHLVASQDTNDLTKAVAFCVRHGATQLKILGAGGLREDHTIANVSLLADYAQQCAVEMITNHGRFTAIRQTTVFTGFVGEQVSVFSLTPAVPVTLAGFKYPLQNARLDAWWKGTLNEVAGNTFSIAFENGVCIVGRMFAQEGRNR